MDLTIRPYDPAQDFDAVTRMWLEVGWLESADQGPALGKLCENANAEVGVVHGEAECMAHWQPGSIRYQDTQLPMSAITAVTTSHVGRRMGLASTLTGRSLQQAADAGIAVASLGIFEQGFYDRLGFGAASYEHELVFDPAALMVGHVPYRQPERISQDQYADIQQALANRWLHHGSVIIDPPIHVWFEFEAADNPFCLGYRDGDGVLTHFILGDMKAGRGPFNVNALAYQDTDQLLELLRLLNELSDQFRSVRILEPAHVQLQVMLEEPFRERARSIGSGMESIIRALSWWQLRILDVEACVAARSWIGEPVRFNLTLTDPIADRFDEGWQGVGGDYTVTIGAESSALAGHEDGLPALSAGVAAFTRLWFGVASASALMTSDDLAAPPELLTALDTALQLPPMVSGWEF